MTELQEELRVKFTHDCIACPESPTLVDCDSKATFNELRVKFDFEWEVIPAPPPPGPPNNVDRLIQKVWSKSLEEAFKKSDDTHKE